MTRPVDRETTVTAPMYPAHPFQPAWQTHWNKLALAELEWWIDVLTKFLPPSEPISIL